MKRIALSLLLAVSLAFGFALGKATAESHGGHAAAAECKCGPDCKCAQGTAAECKCGPECKCEHAQGCKCGHK